MNKHSNSGSIDFYVSKHKWNYWFSLILIIFILFSCKKNEVAGLGNSSLIAIGNQKDSKLLNLIASPDGGFMVAAYVKKTGYKKIWILKYNQDMVLQWERIIGGNFDNRVDKVFIDKDENILVSGFAYGLDEDSLGFIENRNWVHFNHLLSPRGETKWQISETTALSNRDTVSFVTTVTQDLRGNYLVGGSFWYEKYALNINLVKSRYAILNQYSPDGKFTGNLIFDAVAYHRINSRIVAVFEEENDLILFGHHLRSRSDSFDVLLSPEDLVPFGINSFQYVGGVLWPEAIVPYKSMIGDFKFKTQDDKFVYYAVFPDQIHRFTYDKMSSSFYTDFMPTEMKNLLWTEQSPDGHFLFVQQDGKVFEKDKELNTILSFQSEFGVQVACKLINSDFITGITLGKTGYLIHHDETGKIIHHD